MLVYTTVNFDKQFKKLPVRIQEQFKERMLLFVRDSRNSLLKAHTLGGKLSGNNAFSVSGNYRVIYRMIATNTTELVAIGTHSQLYK